MTSVRTRSAMLAALALGSASCGGGAPAVPPPAPMNDSAVVTARWIEQQAIPLSLQDTGATGLGAVAAVLGDARVIGLSELTEGTAEFARVVQRVLAALDDDRGVGGLAIQGPLAEALDVDRYVRGGPGDARRLLRSLGSSHWASPEMLALVEWMRARNAGRPPERQIGFYGIQSPNVARALAVITELPTAVVGEALRTWLEREAACIRTGERAYWGREGRPSDREFWARCLDVVRAMGDSLAAVQERTPRDYNGDIAFAQQMARVLEHTVRVGLAYLPREEAVARHVLWLSDSIAQPRRLVVWGRDIEAGRLVFERIAQAGLPLGRELGEQYRAVAFTVGTGRVRAPMATRSGGMSEGVATLAAPRPGTMEEMLVSAAPAQAAYLVDLRAAPEGTVRQWLSGPRTTRLISGPYAPSMAERFQAALEYPQHYDAVIFVRTATAARRF